MFPTFKVTILATLISMIHLSGVKAESGYEAWLRYKPLENKKLTSEYKVYCGNIFFSGESEIITASLKELKTGIKGMLGVDPMVLHTVKKGCLIISKIDEIPSGILSIPDDKVTELKPEGYIIRNSGDFLIITAKNDIGLLYGTFHLLRLMQMNESLKHIDILENPKNKLRLLNHWDNPGTLPAGVPSVERGYAGESIFRWQELPVINDRYDDYARMLASVGINGSVINNVNTAKNGLEGWKLLTPEYLPKLKALAGLFRRYGIKLYISVNFFSPVIISGLKDADPRNPEVKKWWTGKVEEIYHEIPDFGGFLVKADSEGEPGPVKYGRSQAEGADLLASALRPFGGILMWRAFIYGKEKNLSPDRACQAFEVFKPLDGAFDDNAIVQIKNGPIDFQVREPVSPLFGAMPRTRLLIELQITQEYTGHDKHVCYLVPQWKEIFGFDTYSPGPGSDVSKIVYGVAGVANIGDDRNWTGHILAQANLYGFGRLVWDPGLSTGQITNEWIKQTFGSDKKVLSVVSDILLTSWNTYEDYTSPLGVGLMCNGGGTGADGHFTPAPSSRVSYHHADRSGVGYDRTLATGSGLTGQYSGPVRALYEDPDKCPEELLLFFHHLPYTYILKSGKTIIQHIYDTHNSGASKVDNYIAQWRSLKGLIDDQRFEQVLIRLKQQSEFAGIWRDSINSYFFKMSGITDNHKKPALQE